MREHSISPTVRWFCCLLPLVLAACAGPRESELAAEREMSDTVSQQRQERESAREVPDEVNEALTPGPEAGAPEPERFDVSVRDVPARAFFLGLVDGTDTNIVVHPDVSGRLTLDLEGVTVPEVLEVARDVYGYEYRRAGSIYTIFPNELRTQVFKIDYPDVQRVGVSDTNLNLGRTESSGNDNNRSGSSRGSSGSQGQNSANLLGMLDEEGGNSNSGLAPGARVQTLNRTDFWRSLRQSLAAMIGGEQGDRMVMVNPQAGMIVVKAMPAELNSVREFLERSELSVRRQVILEAKILEVRLNEGYQAGINWGTIGGQLEYGYNWQRTSQEGSPSLSSSENIFTSVLQIGDITDLLDLLENQGSVQVLSSPRVSTVNNQKALIRVGSDEYFVTGISNNTTSNVTSVTSTPNIELSSFFSGIALDVTPQIGENDEVVLHIHPVVSEVEDQLKVFTVGSEEFSLPLAQRGIRESDSIVRARSGQVVVLGGLMQEDSRDNDGKRPLLGDIPLLGSLFRTEQRSRQKTELVILLRPVVVDDDTWQRELDRSNRRMEQMGEGYRDLWEQ